MSSQSRKRAASTPASASASTPASASASKQARVGDGDGATPNTANAFRPHGRVLLDVGGQQFKSSRSTLEGSSSYFRSLLERWDEDADEPLFIDADADAFAVLLSHMRIASNVILPKNDEELCARVLLLAEYLGMDGLLEKVKAKAYRNLHPEAGAEGGDDLAAAFDAEVGTLQEAIDSSMLPARYFAPVIKPPELPERVVKTLIPAPPGYTAMFTNDFFDHGKVMEEHQFDDDGDFNYVTGESVSMDVLSFAVVELRDGTTRVEAVVQRSLSSTISESRLEPGQAHPQLQNHLQFASEVLNDGQPGERWGHHLIVPPPGVANMLPVPQGTIRGVWAKPALTATDVGKKLTVTNSGAIIVDGEVRAVTWGDRPIPRNIKDGTISDLVITDNHNGDLRPQFKVTTVQGVNKYHLIPYLSGAANQIIKDIAFVEMDRAADKRKIATKFYVADSLEVEGWRKNNSNRVVDVIQKELPGGFQFSHILTGSQSGP